MNLPVELVAQNISAEDTPDSDLGKSRLNAVNYSPRCETDAYAADEIGQHVRSYQTLRQW